MEFSPHAPDLLTAFRSRLQAGPDAAFRADLEKAVLARREERGEHAVWACGAGLLFCAADVSSPRKSGGTGVYVERGDADEVL